MELEPNNNNEPNNESNLPNKSSKIQINKEEIQKKLKQDTINLFNQINIGCKRNFCGYYQIGKRFTKNSAVIWKRYWKSHVTGGGTSSSS